MISGTELRISAPLLILHRRRCHPELLLFLLFLLLLGNAARPEDAKDGATWIVVTAPSLRAAIDPLCEHRRSEGYRVVILQTTDVLDPARIRDGDGRPLKDHLAKLYGEAPGKVSVLLVGAVGKVRAVGDAAPDVDQGPDMRLGRGLDQRPGLGPEPDANVVVPALLGAVSRMKGQPTDNGYGRPDDALLPGVAVGRLPARSPEEARAMVRKTLDFERSRAAGPWMNRVHVLLGNPGGATPVERRFAEWFVEKAGASRFAKLHPLWQARMVLQASSSPFFVPDRSLREVCRRYLEEGQVFSFYLGHSGASGLWSSGAPFLSREDWGTLKISGGAGVFITCGCYGCQLAGVGGEGYGISAIRNPDGPAAVIGAHGESYAALGQLAFDGILPLLAEDEPPERLGDWWLALTAGIARAPMDPLTFYLYDQADGSRGKTTLALQRREHLEMWMLLGDPALRLPLAPRDIRLEVEGVAAPGRSLTIRGTLPPRVAAAKVRVDIERPFGSVPPDIDPIQEEEGEARDAALLARHERANVLSMMSREIAPVDGRFECAFRLPESLPWPKVIVRARAEAGGEAALGARALEVSHAARS